MSALKSEPCPHCGNHHAGACPRVKSIEYREDGTTKRVEYHAPVMTVPQGMIVLDLKSLFGGTPKD